MLTRKLGFSPRITANFGYLEIRKRISGIPEWATNGASSKLFHDIYHSEIIWRLSYTSPACTTEKGTPGESRGRKALGLLPRIPRGYDCQAAEVARTLKGSAAQSPILFLVGLETDPPGFFAPSVHLIEHRDLVAPPAALGGAERLCAPMRGPH